MKRFFSHLPDWVDWSACGDFAGEREQHRDRMLGGGDRIAERRVHDHDSAREAAGTSIVSTPMPARPMTFRRGKAASMPRR